LLNKGRTEGKEREEEEKTKGRSRQEYSQEK
jgi:hypothetical protein